MRFHIFIVAATLAGIGLAGCAGSSGQAGRTFGLTSGPLPAPQPFVVDSRASQGKVYPHIGAIPPQRGDRVLSMDERKALEASLLATPGRQPSPEEGATKTKGGKKKRVTSTRKGVGFMPPK